MVPGGSEFTAEKTRARVWRRKQAISGSQSQYFSLTRNATIIESLSALGEISDQTERQVVKALDLPRIV